MKKFIRNNSLSLVFVILFLISFVGQVVSGRNEYNKTQQEEGGKEASLSAYLHSGHFIQATFENWESEFLQMGLFVVLTIFLRQKGSSESKQIDGEEPVDREPSANRKGAPWPVKRGGFILKLYKHSLSISFLVLFLLSFVLHFYGSLKDENHERLLKHLPPESSAEYLTSPRMWFESFQNWQSEFLSVFCIVIIHLFHH